VNVPLDVIAHIHAIPLDRTRSSAVEFRGRHGARTRHSNVQISRNGSPFGPQFGPGGCPAIFDGGGSKGRCMVPNQA
jgi:hypothetical protein